MFGSRTTTHSNFETITNKNFTWRSSDQAFVYYDKEAEERKPLPKGAKLIPLTTTNSVTGVRERDRGKATERYNQIISNEFTDYKNEIVKVREIDRLDNTRNVLFEGVYSPTIKEAISGLQFCKFTKNIYCLLDGEVVKLALSGASLTAWIEFEDTLRKEHIRLVDGYYVTVGEPEHKKSGTVNYYAPTFSLGEISAEENAKANDVAVEVEDKIARNKLASKTVEAVPTVPVQDAPIAPTEEISLDEVPF